jgi:hypothetical protein
MSRFRGVKVVRRVHVSDSPYGNGMRCGGGGCPAVFETDKGTFLVVGRRLSSGEKAELPMDRIEDALEIPRDLLLEAAARLSGKKG